MVTKYIAVTWFIKSWWHPGRSSGVARIFFGGARRHHRCEYRFSEPLGPPDQNGYATDISSFDHTNELNEIYRHFIFLKLFIGQLQSLWWHCSSQAEYPEFHSFNLSGICFWKESCVCISEYSVKVCYLYTTQVVL